jgi:hypothetical protein
MFFIKGEENKSLRRDIKAETSKNSELASAFTIKQSECERYQLNLKQVQDKFKSEMVHAEEEIGEYRKSIIGLEARLEVSLQRNKELEE